MQDFLNHIIAAFADNRLFKLTLAKQRDKADELNNVFFRPVDIGGELFYSATYRYKTNDKTKNYTEKRLMNVLDELLNQRFYNADLYFSDIKVSLLQSKKGAIKVITKKESHSIILETHNHQKRRPIAEDAGYLNDLGLSSANGKVYAHAQDKYKQINKYVELISDVIKNGNSPETIVDMGCGKGYLTFALHDYLNTEGINTKVKGVEIRQDLVDKCSGIAKENGLSSLTFELGSIDTYNIGPVDMVIALHACDIATDMAIAKGLEADAEYIIVAPCCHKQIRKAMTATDSVLNPLLEYGILKERQAEMVTDTIRALILQSKGYDVKVFEFISSEHTGKNVMITAVKTGKSDSDALIKVAALKSEFGIKEHYLETLV